MDELPRDARALLALAKDAHDPPDPGARARVHAKLLAAISVAPVSISAPSSALAQPSAGLWPAWFGSSKVALACALLLLGVGGGAWSLRTPSAPHNAPPQLAAAQVSEPSPGAAPDPVAPQALASTPSVTALPPVAPASPTPRPRAAGARPAAPAGAGEPAGASLTVEVALLARAAAQLEQGETRAALAALAEHQQRFARTQLQQERDGLLVMAHCLARRADAQRAARSYLAKSPAAVLVARVEQACAL